MKLEDWLYFKKISTRMLSKDTNIPYSVCHYFKAQKNKINLQNAIKIQKYTNGEISIYDLLDEQSKIELEKIIPYNTEKK